MRLKFNDHVDMTVCYKWNIHVQLFVARKDPLHLQYVNKYILSSMGKNL